MTIVRKDKERLVAFVKGAPDILLGDCTAIEEKGNTRALTDEDREKILSVNSDLANSALRVLAVAYRRLDTPPQAYEQRLLSVSLPSRD